ncbi:unnamed protein product, partial [Prorocentrum cordatum]
GALRKVATKLLVSLYQDMSIGVDGETMDLLEHAGSLIGQLGERVLIGADWSVKLEVLLAPSWVDQAGAMLLYSDMAICAPSEYDYFVVSWTLAHRVELAAPMDDLGRARSSWLDLAERHLVNGMEVELANVRHYPGWGKGAKIARTPLGELHLARQRKLNTSSAEARAGFLRCWRALRRQGKANTGSRGRRQVLHDQLAWQAETLEPPPAASGATAPLNTTKAQ